MNIDIVCIGKLKEKYLKEAFAEYQKRLTNYIKLNVIEIPEKRSLKEEAYFILERINKNSYIICLCIEGKLINSEELADKINNLAISSKSHITFIIGGCDGLDGTIKDRADYKLSFSRLTFPHQLMRIILIEQIYRSFKIINKEPYHR